MTNEEKQLLIKDLSARLPYGVIVDIKYNKEHGSSDRLRICSEGYLVLNTDVLGLYIQDEIYLKPYLRLLSSMTEEEKLKLVTLYLARDGRCRKDLRIKETELFLNSCWYVQITYKDENDKEVISTVYIGRCSYIEETDWLNKHHFDYRGLIEKGLALPAPKGMYN